MMQHFVLNVSMQYFTYSLPPSILRLLPPILPALPLSQADKLAAAPRPYRAFRRPLDAAEQVSPKLDSIPSLPSTGPATAAQESAQSRCPLLAARTRASRTARHAGCRACARARAARVRAGARARAHALPDRRVPCPPTTSLSLSLSRQIGSSTPSGAPRARARAARVRAGARARSHARSCCARARTRGSRARVRARGAAGRVRELDQGRPAPVSTPPLRP